MGESAEAIYQLGKGRPSAALNMLGPWEAALPVGGSESLWGWALRSCVQALPSAEDRAFF